MCLGNTVGLLQETKLFLPHSSPSWILSLTDKFQFARWSHRGTGLCSFNVARCPRPKCSPHQQGMCGVPPSQYIYSLLLPYCYNNQESICGVPPPSISFFCELSPPCSSVPFPHSALFWILSKVEKLASSSL